MRQQLDYVWVVAYIDKDHVNTVELDLVKNGFSAVKVFIPTIRVLKKQFKNKNIYEYVPLLFNYGFFNIPYVNACDPDFLKKLKEKVPVIYAWVKDPIKTLKSRPQLRVDNKSFNMEIDEEGKTVKYNNPYTPLATVTEEEISNLLKTSEHLSVFSEGIVDKLEPGHFIILKGYPYEGMPAEIVKIDNVKKQVKVKLLLEIFMTEVMVHYENIFYTIYSDFTSTAKEDSLDELEGFGKRTLDKIYAQVNYGFDE